jgi:ATP-dependent DNA helicase RecQ
LERHNSSHGHFLERYLKEYFGHDAFRPGQKEAVEAVMAGRDALMVMPTGGGKSICYQLPAMLLDGMAIVVSPLIALMKDQADALHRANIPATFINSSLPQSEILARFHNAMAGKYKMMYLAPERLESPSFLSMVSQIELSFLAVDEAHCISEWGHDFRASYLKIADLLKSAKIRSIAALTATATSEVCDDIVKSLKMRSPKRVFTGFDRPNLSYRTIAADDKSSELAKLCSDLKGGSAIAYCGSRKRVEGYSKALADSGIYNVYYHAGLPPHARRSAQDAFISGQAKIIVATNAFGMGIDKPDVRKVVHCDLPATLEAYYQEAGRAGRDGKESDCIILYQESDRSLQEFYLRSTYPELRDVEKAYNGIYDLMQCAIGFKPASPLYLDDVQIANRLKMPLMIAGAAISLLIRSGALRRAAGKNMAAIQFTGTRERLFEYLESASPEKQQVMEALLRGASSEALHAETEIDLYSLRKKYNLKEAEVKKAIMAFEYARLLKFNAPSSGGGLILELERTEFDKLPIDFEHFSKRKANAYKKAAIVRRYAETRQCKSNFILNYFQDSETDSPCGHCSSCLYPKRAVFRRSKRKRKILGNILIAAAELNGAFGKKALSDYLYGNKSDQVRKLKLDKASSFASCKNYHSHEVKEEIERAIFDRLIEQTTDAYPKVRITKLGRQRLSHVPAPLEIDRSKNSYDPALNEELKILRNEIANKEGVVPRAIASANALRKLSEIKPGNKSELRKCPGIGPIFVERFGRYFLDLIASGAAKKAPPDISSELPEEIHLIKKLAADGCSLKEISSKANITEAVAARYIQQALEKGYTLPLGNIVGEELINEIKEIQVNKADIALREIRARLSKPAAFPLLRIAVAYIKSALAK